MGVAVVKVVFPDITHAQWPVFEKEKNGHPDICFFRFLPINENHALRCGVPSHAKFSIFFVISETESAVVQGHLAGPDKSGRHINRAKGK